MTPATDGGQTDPSTELAIDYLAELIGFPSVSSTSNVEINQYVATVLKELGFEIAETFYQDHHQVTKANLVAVRAPKQSTTSQTKGLAYFCHTDVVPTQNWIGCPNLPPASMDAAPDPFTAIRTTDRIYGRGACDMKGSLATMLAAVSRIPAEHQTGPVWIVCTADEEVGFEGAKHLANECEAFGRLVKQDPVSIIGEPTELQVVHAHKGIRGIKLRANGKAGHSATDFGTNANEAMVPVLQSVLKLCQQTRTDNALLDDRFDPPTLSWNFGVCDHAKAINITPDRCDAWISFRPMPNVDGQSLVDEIGIIARTHNVEVTLIDGCDPMWTSPENENIKTMEQLSNSSAKTVSYATDGGVWNDLHHRMIIGPGSIAQAHTVDEWIAIDQITRGIDLYERALRHWACGGE
ncbi:M20 family metallopeptidase [Stieleria sp. JC731]|uniref:M20 family metallopeptidase n=1 Tax=Pirellulaceae TaxID=2691357 RepID=UPI001E46FD13|nr:M20 family metallopeptidase [Stieleria sp. JC731]MCC9599338.1 M20 family metallopeptidase [Stieleria sp. JC731]